MFTTHQLWCEHTQNFLSTSFHKEIKINTGNFHFNSDKNVDLPNSKVELETKWNVSLSLRTSQSDAQVPSLESGIELVRGFGRNNCITVEN